MSFDLLLKKSFIIALLALGAMRLSAAAEPVACAQDSESCLASCRQIDDEAKAAECKNSCAASRCETPSAACEGSCESRKAEPLPEVAAPAEPTQATPAQAREPEPPTTSEPTPPSEPPTPAPMPESPASPASPESPVVAEPATPSLPAAEVAPPVETPSPSDTRVAVEEKLSKPREPKVATALNKSAMTVEIKKNKQMLEAIWSGDLKTIRRLIEKGLSPTYVYAYEQNPQTSLFDAKPVRLRLNDLFNDGNGSRNDASGLDRILTLFVELGMDIKATLATTVTASDGRTVQVAKTAWGPDLRTLETMKDREARMRAFEMSLQAGLAPNDDIGERLWADLPQVCGRDKSKFAIQVVDLLVKYLGPSLQSSFKRTGANGPETMPAVLDRSYATRKAKNAYEAEQIAKQDFVWEQCAPLSRRINRFLTQGT